MFDGQNLWVFKPNDYNRGKGVCLFKSIDELRRLLVDYTQGVEVKPLNQKEVQENKDKEGEEQTPVKLPPAIIKSDVFVI